jgi:hypothetical protein
LASFGEIETTLPTQMRNRHEFDEAWRIEIRRFLYQSLALARGPFGNRIAFGRTTIRGLKAAAIKELTMKIARIEKRILCFPDKII